MSTLPNNNNIEWTENPIDIVLVLLHEYPQIEQWLKKMEYYDTLIVSKTESIQLLNCLMETQPHFIGFINLIQQRLKDKQNKEITKTRKK